MNLNGYTRSIEILIKECDKIKSTGIKSVCLAGFHPAEIDKLINVHKQEIEKVLDLAEKLFDHIAKLCMKGKLIGIGEVGRQHYKTEPLHVVVANLIMDRALEIAKDLDVMVHLHLEQGGLATVMDIDKRVKRIGVKKERIILHHLNTVTARAAKKYGFPFTILGIEKLLKSVIGLKASLLVESDFLDDPKRPGAVMYPWDIPRNVIRLVDEGLMSEDDVLRIFVDNVVRTYRIT